MSFLEDFADVCPKPEEGKGIKAFCMSVLRDYDTR
jgi:hypothetical protein